MTEAAIHSDPLPVGGISRRANGWYGMLALIMTEAALFAYLEFSYYYFAVQYGHEWLPELPKLHLSLPNTVILLASSVTAQIAQRGVESGRRPHLIWGLVASIVLGAVFVFIQTLEWGEKTFTMSSAAYGSVFFTTTGFHMAHVVVGLIMLVMVLIWAWLGYFDRRRNTPVIIGVVYWHFVDIVWLTIFFMFYLTPRLG